MGSISAMENGSKDRYFQSDARSWCRKAVEGRVAYKGTVEGHRVPAGLAASVPAWATAARIPSTN